MRDEAIALLKAVALRDDIEQARVHDFAKSVLAATEFGALVLSVLEGGEGGERALVELAALVVGE